MIAKPGHVLECLGHAGVTGLWSRGVRAVREHGWELPPALCVWGVLALAVRAAGDMAFVKPYWQYMVDNYDEFTIASGFTFVLHETLYFGIAVPFLAMELLPGVFGKYKIQRDKPNEGSTVWKCFKGLVITHIFVQVPMMTLTHWFLGVVGFSMATEEIPHMSWVAGKVILCFLVEDFYFYWIHRFLHWKRIYKYVHKVHHVHPNPFGIAAEYAHPVEVFFLGVGTIIGPVLFARHLIELWIWLFFRLYETIEDHTGYDLPWNPTNWIPFWGGPVHHDHHHKTFEGNYASVFSIWDRVFGTDKEFRQNQSERRARGESTWTDLFDKLGLVPETTEAAASTSKKQK